MSLSPLSSAFRSIGISVLLLFVLFIAASAQTTAFHYQGRLNDSTAASPTTGTYDLQFTLWDSETNGCPVGIQITKTSVAVTTGVFSVDLDFGNEFPGADRWLEIAVKKPADSSYTTLTPRQKIASVPYAVQALNVNTTSGNSIVTALNDTSTTYTITADKISDGVAKVGISEQSTTSTDMTAPVINIKSIRDNGNGTTTDIGRFRVGRDGSLVSSGIFGVGSIPVTGGGTRLMWYPARSAFRVGSVGSTEWDDTNIGQYSFAGGFANTAKGIASVALGRYNKALSQDNTAIGYSNVADAPGAVAIGVLNKCTGYLCVALGYQNTSIGYISYAFGNSNIAAGDGSFVLGARASTCRVTLDTSGTYPTCSSPTSYAFVWSDGGSTVIAQTDREFRARAVGGFRLRTSEDASDAVGMNGNVGCDLDNGSSVWTCASSRSLKENFTGVNGEDILRRLRKMPMTTWNFIGENGAPLHLGPVAEDFYEAFKLGKSDKSIGVQDLAGVSLAATKALEERTAKLQAENDALRLQISDLAKRLEKIEKSRSVRRSAKR